MGGVLMYCLLLGGVYFALALIHIWTMVGRVHRISSQVKVKVLIKCFTWIKLNKYTQKNSSSPS